MELALMIATQFAIAICVVAAIIWGIVLLFRFMEAHADGEQDAQFDPVERPHDEHVGFWKGVYDTAFSRELDRQKLVKERRKQRGD